MRVVLILVAAIVSFVGCQEASARTINITGTVTRSRLFSACQANGGTCGNCRGTSGSYSCDATTSGTSVTCTSKGKCTGQVPDFYRGPHTLGEILRVGLHTNR
jgi:hypothetical protein